MPVDIVGKGLPEEAQHDGIDAEAGGQGRVLDVLVCDATPVGETFIRVLRLDRYLRNRRLRRFVAEELRHLQIPKVAPRRQAHRPPAKGRSRQP